MTPNTARGSEGQAAYLVGPESRLTALREAVDDLWGCIGKAEMDDLQPETVEIAKALHEDIWHGGDGCPLDPLLNDLRAEVERQDRYHPSGYPATRDGVRFGIATVIDEAEEARDAWRAERCKCATPLCGHAKWGDTEAELLQTAAVALRTIRSIREARRAR